MTFSNSAGLTALDSQGKQFFWLHFLNFIKRSIHIFHLKFSHLASPSKPLDPTVFLIWPEIRWCLNDGAKVVLHDRGRIVTVSDGAGQSVTVSNWGGWPNHRGTDSPAYSIEFEIDTAES